ncbi:MAG: RdgB/HAM1 family non-canonical purine NTP pyrophosphatase [Sulfurimonas sp.]|uniref:RdgB/HAM1 family non-canonical purine NTP pyrophosphatase n=1 Tax=Sulfurimonas sp. TaxID=2022749 RepID=UPI00261AFC3E|nr:RdgB/HAM1 family non-canonical purine NTP pyrophosphatase [Sulfurimonas sp.]MCW8895495.1 RdgB/HAM1 family non-canonical purine NTP pyrophosphatase [Sulfurimonas sp.]MCW8954477.1 RdgB/HAM1 family non-canonical purine NTP pyrophosphatase [Sulfurimonas sp.]MCW9067797.1 RdgB/HAM1 family non-canonical purine NTP pyrophosphatase [Sulfurimonas sp.]
MKLVLATSNKGKVREIKALCEDYEVIPYSELIQEFEIIEDADTFKENALIKARAVFKALKEQLPSEYEDIIVLADDSGISVDVLDGAPGIYSARYGGKNANDKDNLYKLIEDIKEKGVESSPAHYTAAIAIVTKKGEYSVHGWMHGTALTKAIGDGGFGYDPMFIPLGYDKTLGELDDEVKKKLSHRSKALSLAKVIIENF